MNPGHAIDIGLDPEILIQPSTGGRTGLGLADPERLEREADRGPPAVGAAALVFKCVCHGQISRTVGAYDERRRMRTSPQRASCPASLTSSSHEFPNLSLVDSMSSTVSVFYDALRTNESAVRAMQDEVMQQIAHELTEIVRRDAKTDWAVKEQVRAKLRTTIKRLLLKHGYPPDKAPDATELILKQAEVMGSGMES